MSQIRLDFVTKRPVIFTDVRENKPNEFWSKSLIRQIEKVDNNEYAKGCPFCKGNESMTPADVYRVENDQGWLVKIVPNMYPIIQEEKESKKINDLCYVSTGIHEVIIETPQHNQTYFTMDAEQFERIYTSIHKRYGELIKDKGISYVSVFKNYKMFGGASMQHSHSQIMGLDVAPIKLEREIVCAQEEYDKLGVCPYCKMIEEERKEKKRLIYEDDFFIAVEPYAPGYKYETWILPKKHIAFFEKEKNIRALAHALYRVYRMLYNALGDFPFNMYLNSLLKNREACQNAYHYSFRIIPRISGSAGFEMSSGIRVNPMLPEIAAENILKRNPTYKVEECKNKIN